MDLSLSWFKNAPRLDFETVILLLKKKKKKKKVNLEQNKFEPRVTLFKNSSLLFSSVYGTTYYLGP